MNEARTRNTILFAVVMVFGLLLGGWWWYQNAGPGMQSAQLYEDQAGSAGTNRGMGTGAGAGQMRYDGTGPNGQYTGEVPGPDLATQAELSNSNELDDLEGDLTNTQILDIDVESL